MIVAFLILAAVYGGIHVYLARRLVKGLSLFLPLKKGWCYGAFAVLAVGTPLSFAVRGNTLLPDFLISFCESWGAVWMGVFVYLLLFTVLSDLLLLLFRLIPSWKGHRQKAKAFASAAVLVLTLAVCAVGLWGGATVEKVSYDLSDGGEEIRIALLSDIHLGTVGSMDRLEQSVALVNEMDADLVCLAGDIFNDDFSSVSDPERAKELLSSMRSRYGAFAVLGNHDSGETLDQMRELLRDAGVTLLPDEAVEIDGKFVLAGRLDLRPIGKTEGLKRGELSDFLSETDLPVIVMDHNPAEADLYGENVDLVLSGHTHKGQIFPGNLITRSMYTVDYGTYRKDPSSPTVVVSSGSGLWGPPMRVGTQNEVVEIRFSLHP